MTADEKDRRIAELETILLTLQRAVERKDEKGVKTFARVLIDPTNILDRFLDRAWVAGIKGERHPCWDSTCEESRALARASESEHLHVNQVLGMPKEEFMKRLENVRTAAKELLK